MNVFRAWVSRQLSNPQLVSLILILVGGVLVVLFFGRIIAPVLASIVVAYLFDAPVERLSALRVPRTLSAAVISLALLLGVIWISLLLMPLLMRQAGQFIQQLPGLLDRAQTWISGLPSHYPSLISQEQMDALIGSMSFDIGPLRHAIVSRSLMVGVSLIYLAVYLVLVPLMVFFLLRDKQRLLSWVGSFVPRDSELLRSVWNDVNRQLGNYVRGKALEIVIVWVVADIVFSLLGLNYATLLSAIFGISVLVPYIGAFGMVIPVTLVAYAQWGIEPHTLWAIVAYTILSVLDGNVLVPILFSEAVNLHPVAIITAVFFFGGIWGFWGVFFAIPLATLVQSVIKAWPRGGVGDSEDVDR